MKSLELNPILFGESNQEFKDRFNKDLDICELSEESKRGFLFFLGAYLPGMLTDNFGNDEKSLLNAMPILGLYSKSTCNFSDYGELNDGHFAYWIYNTATLLSNIIEPGTSVDEYFRKVGDSEIIIGKTELNHSYIKEYADSTFNLNLIQKINDRFFIELGKELVEKSFSLERSYEAGMAYRMMMTQMDINGTQFLIKLLSNNLAVSPMYRSLLYMPTLFHTNKHAFTNNHLFSQILNALAGSGNESMIEIFKPIHKLHQFIFYKEGTSEIRDEWEFERHNNIGSGLSIFLNALEIRNSGLVEEFKNRIDLEEVYFKEIINKSVSKDQLISDALHVIREKYGIEGMYEFTKGANGWNDGGWNNKGEYIQFLAALFYETCLHAMVVEEII